jgi:hypothetical protein
MLEVELNTLDPKSFDNIQDLFTKFKSLILSFGECGIDKSTQEKQIILTILAKVGPRYVVYVSNFHFGYNHLSLPRPATRVDKNHTYGLHERSQSTCTHHA